MNTPGIPEPTPMPDPDKQFVVLHWRDDKINAMKIAESDVPLRYKDYEFVETVVEFLQAAQPGDTIAVRSERVLRVR